MSVGAIVALHDEAAGKLWKETVPGGSQVLEFYAKLLSTDPLQALEDTKTKATEQVQTVKREMGTTLDVASKTLTELQKDAESALQKATDVVQDALHTLDEYKESASKVLGEAREKTETLYQKSQQTIESATESVSKVTSSIRATFDDVKALVTGETKTESGHPSPQTKEEVDVPLLEKKTKLIVTEEKKEEPVDQPVVKVVTDKIEEPQSTENTLAVVAKDLPADKIEPTQKPHQEPTTSEPVVVVAVPEIQEVVTVQDEPKDTPPPVGSQESITIPDVIPTSVLVQRQAQEESKVVPAPTPSHEDESPLSLAETELPVVIVSTQDPGKPSLDLSQFITTESETVRKFMESIFDLALSLGELSLSLSGSHPASAKLEKAKQEIIQLSNLVADLEAHESSLVSRALEEQGEAFARVLRQQMEDAYGALTTQAQELQSLYESQLRQQNLAQEEAYQKEVQEKLAALEGALGAQKERELSRLAEDLTDKWTRTVQERVDAERDGRLAKLDTLSSKLKVLETLTLDARERLGERLGLDQLALDVEHLESQVRGSKHRVPLSLEMKALKEHAKEHAFVGTVLEGVPSEAIRGGVASLEELKWELGEASLRMRRVQLMPPDGGPLSYVLSYLLSFFVLSKSGLVPGSDTESVLSRARHYLGKNDLDSATRELNQVRGWQRLYIQDWLQKSRRRLELLQTLEVPFFIYSFLADC